MQRLMLTEYNRNKQYTKEGDSDSCFHFEPRLHQGCESQINETNSFCTKTQIQIQYSGL